MSKIKLYALTLLAASFVVLLAIFTYSLHGVPRDWKTIDMLVTCLMFEGVLLFGIFVGMGITQERNKDQLPRIIW